MTFTKKYFSLAEVLDITGLSAHKLRYIEKTTSNIKVIKIRGRRYYTENDIKFIKQQVLV